MALRQLLGVTCLAVHVLTSFVGVHGVRDQFRGPSINPKDPFWNSTGHMASGISAAPTPSRPNTLTPEGSLAPRTTPSSGQPYRNASAVWWEHPRRPHPFLRVENAVQSATTVLSSSKITLTPTGTGSLLSTDNINPLRRTSRGNFIASPSHLGLASAYNDSLQFVRPLTARPGRSVASVRDKYSTATWSPPSLIASSAISMTGSGSGNGVSKNISASWKPTAAASGPVEGPKSVEYLGSNRDESERRTRLAPGLGRRPLYIHSTRLPLAGLEAELDATPGVLVPIPHLGTATESHKNSSSNFNISTLETGTNSAWEDYLASLNKNNTEGRHLEGPKPYEPSHGLSLPDFSNSTFNRTSNHLGVIIGNQYVTTCSGLVTSTAHVVYETVTSTILVNETITLGPNATTPLPMFITPPPACQIINASCEGAYCPPTSPRPYPKKPLPKAPIKYTPSTSTSTLLVTKKSVAVVQQLSSVGNLFGPSTPVTPAVAAQSTVDGQQSAEHNSGQSNSEMSTQSDHSSSPEPDVSGQAPGKLVPQQNPSKGNSPSASSDGQSSDSQKPAPGSGESQSTNSNNEAALKMNELHAAASENGAASSNGDTSSNVGASGDEHTVSSGDTNANTGGRASSHSKESNNGDSSNREGASNNGRTSSDESGPEPEDGSSVDSDGTQYVPSIITAGDLPVTIASNAVIVGSHTVKAGSPPTKVVANGQTIDIQPSQIVAQGKTVLIQAAVTPPPVSSATIGNIRVLLRPPIVAIGSKTFEHGSLPTSVIYNGQTYSWDASHLVGPGATIAFPMVNSAPHVTVGGQVFSVFPSQLKAPGRNIALPTIATASPFVYKGQTFSVNPSQIIAPDTSITLPPARKVTPFIYIDHSLSVDASNFMARSTTIPLSFGSGTVTYNGQVLTIKPFEVIGPSTTIALSAPDDSAASPTAVTTGGLTFSIGPSAAVVGSSTYSFVPGKAPATVMTHGEAVLVGSNGVQFKNVHVPIPTVTPNFSLIIHESLTFSIAPSKVVVDGHTDVIHSDMTPITTVIEGHTISIGPKGVGLACTTIPLPVPKPTFSMATAGNIRFSLAPSEVVVKGKTYSIASNKAPITTDINGQIMTFGPKGIHIKGTTVNLPVIQTSTSVTAAGLSFFVGATDAVISGTTYAIGSGALLQTIVVGSQTMEIGSAGIMLPSTTIVSEQTLVAVTAGDLTFSIDSTRAVVNGTSYAIGSGAVAATIIEGLTTMILGTNGVALPWTTIRPWSNGASTGLSSMLGTSRLSPTANATKPLVPLATGKEGDLKHAAGASTRVSHSGTLLGLLLGVGTMLLGLRLV